MEQEVEKMWDYALSADLEGLSDNYVQRHVNKACDAQAILSAIYKELDANLGQHGPELPPMPDCPICKGSGFRFSACFCSCEIGRQKLGETISAKPDLDATKEAFHISRADTGQQHGPEEQTVCNCQYGQVEDEITGEMYPCYECDAGKRQHDAEESAKGYYESAARYALRAKEDIYAW